MAARAYERGAVNRVILCSDGVANTGLTGADDILATIAREAGRGIEMTAIGVGMGNFNDVLLEQLADKGDGNYFYVDDPAEARRVFVDNLTGTLQTIAKDAKIQVEFDPDNVRRYRLLGYENRDVADRDFRNDAVDAGEVGAGHEVTALFEAKLEKDAGGDLATVRIRYQDAESGRVVEEARTIRVKDIERRLRSDRPQLPHGRGGGGVRRDPAPLLLGQGRRSRQGDGSRAQRGSRHGFAVGRRGDWPAWSSGRATSGTATSRRLGAMTSVPAGSRTTTTRSRSVS